MTRLLILALFLFGQIAAAQTPAGYYTRADGLSGGPLKAALHEIIRNHTVIPYAQLHAPLARLHQDPANPNNVILLYSADSVPKGTDFITASWNREHAWPRSRGNADETGPDDSDLHYIWPCYSAVNSARGNFFFDLSDRNDPAFRSPAHPLAPPSSIDSNSWEPPVGQRGALARCLFYVAVRYEGNEPATSDMELVSYLPSGSQMGNLNTLLRWHAEEPVTAAERQRNNLIHSDYQRNRNPFIDHPEWVALIWGSPLENAAGSHPLARVDATVANASEQPSYPGEYKITLVQAAPSGGVQIAFRLTGSAAAAIDYVLSGAGVSYDDRLPGGTVLIPAGASSATIKLTPFADGIPEPAETATLVLHPGPGYTVVPNASRTATLTLNDLPVLPAVWRFDAGAPFANPLPGESGNALLRFDAWTGTLSSFSGVTGDALALVGNSGNDSHVLISLSMTGHRDLAVGFQTRGTASGFSTGTWAWSTDGVTFTAMTGANTASTSSTFSNRNVTFSSVNTLNNAAAVTLRYTLSGATSSSGNNRIDDLQVTATPTSSPTPFAPQIVRTAAGTSAAVGTTVSFFVEAMAQPAPTYQWFKDGVTLPGATSATLTIPLVTHADEGAYRVSVTNPLGTLTSTPIALTTLPAVSRLINVATRAVAGDGDAVLIAGFVIGGSAAKEVLIRGAGPALTGFGVSATLADPKIELYQGGSKLAENDDWNASDAGIHVAAGAFAFTSGSKDAALVRSLAPGSYTVHLGNAGAAGATGVGLVEVFETKSAATTHETRLVNLSTRAFVGTGQDILIPGVVLGTDASTPPNTLRLVLIRAVGPGLAEFNVSGFLARPRIRVLAQNGVVLAENTGWQSAGDREALLTATQRAGAFPLQANRADSALLVSLSALPYTIQVSGADGGTGVALVEVYEVP